MSVRRPRKDDAQESRIEQVLRIGKILRDLLLDGAPLLFPKSFREKNVTHPNRFDVESDFKIARRNRKEILRHGLLGSGVKIAAHRRDQVGKLGRRKSRTAAK